MLLRFKWRFHIRAPADRLWRYISDTGSLNRAAGLPEWKLRYVPESDGGSRQIGETRYMGWRLRWDERPFEWIEGREYRVLREYHNGPIRRFWMRVRLFPLERGTLVEETVSVEPRWRLLAPGLYWEIGLRSKRRFRHAYKRIERFFQGRTGTPFELTSRQPISTERIDRLRQHLIEAEGAEWLPRLIEALETRPDADLDRMRAFAFADEWSADRKRVLKLFLHAAAAGLLDLSWDVICPSCRGAKARTSGLRDLRVEAHCDACNIHYTADFARSVEVTFRPNPAIRPLDVAAYCSGGPMNAPHVVVQQQIPPGETRTVRLRLSPWRYRLRSLKIPFPAEITVRAVEVESRVAFSLGRTRVEPAAAEVGSEFILTVRNESGKAQTVMLERSADRGQATTAAEVTLLTEFRRLFSSEVLAPDIQVRAGTMSLMFTDLRGSTALYEKVGDTSAYARVRRHFELLRDVIAAHEGTVVKTIGDAVMAAFADPARAVEAAFDMHARLEEENRAGNPPLTLKIGIHQGPCFAVNMNETLDYFGTVVNVAARIQKESRGGDIVVTDEIFDDAAARRIIAGRARDVEPFEIEIRGLSGTRRVHRITLPERG